MSAAFITQFGFIALEKDVRAVKKEYAKFLRGLTLVYNPLVGSSVSRELFKLKTIGGRPHIVLPRTLISEFRVIFGDRVPIKNMLPLPNLITRPIEMQVDLFDNQAIIVDRVMGALTPHRQSSGTAAVMLDARAGLGKTYMMAAIISRLKMRTLYIVPTISLCTQAVADLRLCLHKYACENDADVGSANDDAETSNDDAESQPPGTGELTGLTINAFSKRNEGAINDITVIVINSALLRSDEYLSQFSVVIYDEVHMYCSATRAEIFRRTCTHVNIGMSATTGDRSDGFDKIAAAELAMDGIIYASKLPGFTENSVAFDGSVRAIQYYGAPEFTRRLTHDATGNMFIQYMNQQFMRDSARCKLILREIKTLYDWVGSRGQRHCIFVFCEDHASLGHIYSLLNGVAGLLCPELVVENGAVKPMTGKSKTAEVEECKVDPSTRIILTTYGFSGTGVSIARMTAIVFVTSRKSNMKQIVPRILRSGSDLSIPRVVVDIIDAATPIRNHFPHRRRAYEHYNMKVTVIKKSHEDV